MLPRVFEFFSSQRSLENFYALDDNWSMIQMLDKNLITTLQAADRIGCTPNHVRLMLKRGLLRGEKVSGNLWLCDKRHVDQVAKRPSSVGRPRGDKKKQ